MQTRYECSQCTRISCNKQAADQHNRYMHGNCAQVFPVRSRVKLVTDLAAARAEIEELKRELRDAEDMANKFATKEMHTENRAEKAEAERDEALAAEAEYRREIQALTPADAKAALEAYGREKVREGMHLAATIAGMKSAVLPHYSDITRGYAQGRSGAREAILAKMEKLK